MSVWHGWLGYIPLAPRALGNELIPYFVACDIVSLLFQAAGGAITTSDDGSTVHAGINIMINGLASQVASLTLYLAICIHFICRIYWPKYWGPYNLNQNLKNGPCWSLERHKGSEVTLEPQFARLRASKIWTAFLICRVLNYMCIYPQHISSGRAEWWL